MEKDKNNDFLLSFFSRLLVMLFIIHIVYLAMYFVLNVDFMMFFNIGSVTIYATTYFLVKKRKVSFFVPLEIIGLEVFLHALMSTIFIGFNAGFTQHYYALTFIAFYLAALTKKEKYLRVNKYVIAIILVLAIIALRINFILNEPFHPVSKIVASTIYIFNAVLSLLIIAFYMVKFSTMIEKRENQLSAFANKDALTSLFNRRKMRDFFTLLISDMNRGKYKFSVAIIDIDDFKQVNDCYGHDAGDFILIELASIFIKHAHYYDFFTTNETISCPDLIVSRWGGEEFLIAQTFKEDAFDAVKILDKIRKDIEQHEFVYHGFPLHVTITAGIAEHKKDEKISDTIQRSDIYLYKGKANGKNQVVSDFVN